MADVVYLCIFFLFFSFPPDCPIIWVRCNVHRWSFAIVFCHMPSFFANPTIFRFLSTASIHLVLGRTLFLFPGGSCLLSAFRHVLVVVKFLNMPKLLQYSFCHYAAPRFAVISLVEMVSLLFTPLLIQMFSLSLRRCTFTELSVSIYQALYLHKHCTSRR